MRCVEDNESNIKHDQDEGDGDCFCLLDRIG